MISMPLMWMFFHVLALLPLASGVALPKEILGLDVGSDGQVNLLQVGQRFQQPPKPIQIPLWEPHPAPVVRSTGVPELVVDLDAAPELRWHNVTSYYKRLGAYPDCCRLSKEYEADFKAALENIPIHEEYIKELQGIVAEVGHPEVTVLSLLVSNHGYELSGSFSIPNEIIRTYRALSKGQNTSTTVAGCSAVLAAQKNGTVVHGRNMDFLSDGILVENGHRLYLPDTTIDVLFMKGGKPFITSTNWPGSIGIHSGMRFGAWSFQQNTRYHAVAEDIMYGMMKRSEGFMLAARRVMETTPDFDEAVEKLYNYNWMAPQYFIMAGALPYQGAIVTVDRGGEHLKGSPPVVKLNSQTTVLHQGAEQSDWLLVQTNDDQNEKPMDYRRGNEAVRLSTAKQDEVDLEWLFGEMVAPALLNDRTVFTNIFVPGTGYHKTYTHPDSHR